MSSRAVKIIRALLVLLAVANISTDAAAQNTNDANREAVRRASLDYLEGFYEGDTTKIARSVMPTVFKYGYSKRPTGYRGMQMPYDQFIAFAEGVQQGRNRPPAGAPKDVVLFDVQDQTASTKVTAWWGIDYLLLAKQPDGRWMITHVLWQSTPPKP